MTRLRVKSFCMAVTFGATIASALAMGSPLLNLASAKYLNPELIITVITAEGEGWTNETVITFIHVLNNECVGYMRIRPDGDSAYYLSLFEVEPPYRNQQYGSRLFKLLKVYLKSIGCLKLRWQAKPISAADYTQAKNLLPRLIKFYESHGGKIVECYDTSCTMAMEL